MAEKYCSGLTFKEELYLYEDILRMEFYLLFYSLQTAFAAHITQMMYFRVNRDGKKAKK